jgi:hypothetical protein
VESTLSSVSEHPHDKGMTDFETPLAVLTLRLLAAPVLHEARARGRWSVVTATLHPSGFFCQSPPSRGPPVVLHA